MKAGIYLDSNLAGWDSAFLRFFNSPSTSGGKRFVGCPKQRRLAPARRHFLQRLDLTILHQQRTIEIVDRGANVPGQEIKRFLDARTCGSSLHGHGQMLFTGGKRRQFRMSHDHARRNTGIG
jgi:hypothetical protein